MCVWLVGSISRRVGHQSTPAWRIFVRDKSSRLCGRARTATADVFARSHLRAIGRNILRQSLGASKGFRLARYFAILARTSRPEIPPPPPVIPAVIATVIRISMTEDSARVYSCAGNGNRAKPRAIFSDDAPRLASPPTPVCAVHEFAPAL